MRAAAQPDPEVEIDEAKLIRRVLSGHKDDFQTLIEIYQGRIFAMITRQVGNECVTKDLAQETFIRAYQNLSKFRFESRFSTWLTRIALNVTSTYFSSRQFREHRQSLSLEASPIHETLSPTSDTGENYSALELEELRCAIGHLKPKFREVLVLCALENKRYHEVASLLRIPVGTVCSRMNTALMQLRKSLGRRHL